VECWFSPGGSRRKRECPTRLQPNGAPKANHRTGSVGSVALQKALAVRLTSVNRHFDTTVLLASSFRIVSRDRLGFTLPRCRETGPSYALCSQVRGCRIRPAVRESLIVGVITYVVGVANDEQLRVGISVKTGCQLFQILSGRRLNLVGVECEEEP